MLSVGLDLLGLDEFLLESDSVGGLLVLEGLLHVIELCLKDSILSLEPGHLFLNLINLVNMFSNLVLKFCINPLHMLILRHILQVIILGFKIPLSQLSLNRLLNNGVILSHDLIIVFLKQLKLMDELGR